MLIRTCAYTSIIDQMLFTKIPHNSYIAVLCSIYSFELSKNTMLIQRIRHIVTQNEFYSNNIHPIVVARLTHSICIVCLIIPSMNPNYIRSIQGHSY